MSDNQPVDPFHHLHDENYADVFAKGRVGHAGMVFMGGRETIGLGGEWRFVLDLFDEGLRQKWYEHPPSDPTSWETPRDYDGGDWQTAPVPSCWNLLKPEWFHFEGAAWHTRFFTPPPLAPGERLVLRIGAANYEARIFVNGVFAASHRGGSTPLFVDITALLAIGENRLQIQVDNRRRATQVPMHHFDWFNYGGVYREVALVRLPGVFIRDFGLALALARGGGAIDCDVTLSGAVDGIARLDIPELGVAADIPIEAGQGRARIAANPGLWSPEKPRLYETSLTFGADKVRDRIGFRAIAADGCRILLNGEELFLRGVCVHEDDLTLGKGTDEADMRRRFAHARELGANVLRLAHYPHHELAAQIADEVGLMLWEEVPVYWAIDFDNRDTYADAQNQLRELIRRDRNRASVIIWGVGNENADTDARYRFMRDLTVTARAADPTRLISAACLINRTTFAIEDRLAAHLDIIGLNEYFGWYEPSMEGLERLLVNSSPGKPVVISETGADAYPGLRSDTLALFSEDRQAAVIEAQAQVIARAAYVRGLFVWLLYDFRSPRRQTGLQRGFNLKGLIGADKATKKLAFDRLARLYASSPPERGAP